jgi:hypothetical protein
MDLRKTFQIVVVAVMLMSGQAFADWGAKAYTINFTADEQRAAAQGARGAALTMIAADTAAPVANSPVAVEPQAMADTATAANVASQTSMPVAVWLLLAGLAGLGLLGRRQK